jgi:hypothetical protein
VKQEKVYETSWSKGRARKSLINYPREEKMNKNLLTLNSVLRNVEASNSRLMKTISLEENIQIVA